MGTPKNTQLTELSAGGGMKTSEAQRRSRKKYYESHKSQVKERCKKYEKTKKGYLMRTYRNMQSRVSGIQKNKAHLYQGKSLLPREEFYVWALADPNFNTIYHAWVLSGYHRKISPSINRIDSSRGYELDNMEWLTHSENSRLGSLSRHYS